MLWSALWFRGAGQKATEVADGCGPLYIPHRNCVHLDVWVSIHFAFWAKSSSWELLDLPQWDCDSLGTDEVYGGGVLMLMRICRKIWGILQLHTGNWAGKSEAEERKLLMWVMGEKGLPQCHCWYLEQQMNSSASLGLPHTKGQVRQSGNAKTCLFCSSFPRSP